jgi:hypothetical protein
MTDAACLKCDDCGALARKPAIDLGLLVFCPACSARHGMFPGEYGTTRSYAEWTALANRAQASVATASAEKGEN